MTDELRTKEAEHAELLQRLDADRLKSKELDDEEDKYLTKYNEYKRQLYEFEDAERSVDNQLKNAQAELDRLNKQTFSTLHSISGIFV